jgi:hypothetical protein
MAVLDWCASSLPGEPIVLEVVPRGVEVEVAVLPLWSAVVGSV